MVDRRNLIVLLLLCCLKDVDGKESMKPNESQESLNFYSFPVMDITENLISLEEFHGKVSLVVNVASKCGYTDNHYRMLNLLQKMFEDTNKFTVLAFPCNQFGGQEPGNHHEIYEFAHQRMGANFPVFAKVDIIKQDINPAWQYLIDSSGQEPTWNFWKYLVDHNGLVIKAWGPSISPDQLYPDIKSAVDEAMLARPVKTRFVEKGAGSKRKSDDNNHDDKIKDEF